MTRHYHSMKYVLTIMFLFGIVGWSSAQRQNPIYDSYISDTIILNDIAFKKTVAYRLDSVTILTDYEDFKKELYASWKHYRKGMKGMEKAKRKGDYINPEYEPRWRRIDSVFTLIQFQAKTQDTIFLQRSIFDEAKMAGSMSKFFPNLIDSKRCVVLDERNEIQRVIIRQKGSKSRDPLGSYGGRAYYLPGKSTWFVEARDWSS
jgi:hypothetical protein